MRRECWEFAEQVEFWGRNAEHLRKKYHFAEKMQEKEEKVQFRGKLRKY